MMTTNASVVIIESQPLMRAALSTALSEEGITVLTEIAHDWDVLTSFSNTAPDMILFSCDISEQDKFEALSSLRKAFPQTTLVALVNGESKDQVLRALDYGAHLVVDKTAPRAILLEKLTKFQTLII